MVEIEFRYKELEKGRVVNTWEEFPIDLVADIADGSIRYMSLSRCAYQSGRNRHFELISRLLESIPSRLEKIQVSYIDQVSPEYLVFFVSLFNKTKSLSFYQGLNDDASIACLKAGLLRHDGIMNLEVDHFQDERMFSAHQMRLLFEGIANSPSLESLRLNLFCQLPNDSISNEFISALRRAKNLKSLVLNNQHTPLVTQENLAEFLEAAIVDAGLEELEFNHQRSPLELSTLDLKQVVCRKECRLVKLHWEGTTIACPAEDTKFPTRCEANSTVKELLIDDCDGSENYQDDGVRMVSLFQSLDSLKFHINGCADLDMLADFMVQDNCTIQDLEFWRSCYDEEDFFKFCARIPQMKSIVDLNVQANPFLANETHVGALINGILGNPNLESVLLERDTFCEPEYGVVPEPSQDELNRWEKRWYGVIQPHLHLNRAGLHRVRQKDSGNQFPSILMPFVLKRASTIQYSDRCEEGQDNCRTGAVFGLLRANMDTILGLG